MFWRCSEREIVAVFDAFRETEQRWHVMAGTVCATICNAQRTISDPIFKWDDFFTSAKQQEGETWQSPEDMEKILAKFDSYGRVMRRRKNAKSS